jgi:hypothetical protein
MAFGELLDTRIAVSDMDLSQFSYKSGDHQYAQESQRRAGDNAKPGTAFAGKFWIVFDLSESSYAEVDSQAAGQKSPQGEKGNQAKISGRDCRRRTTDWQEHSIDEGRRGVARLNRGIEILSTVPAFLGDCENHLAAEWTRFRWFGH